METTYYSIYSNIRKFLEDLRKNPINAEPSDFLKKEGFDKDKLIRILLKIRLIERKERIVDANSSDKNVPTYMVRYTIIGDKFEEKMRKIYDSYYNKGQKINEEGEGSAITDGGSADGATNAEGVGGQYTAPLNGGKPMRRKIYITESQLVDLLNQGGNEEMEESTDCGGVGNFAYAANSFSSKRNKFFSSAMSRPRGGISIGHMKTKKNHRKK